jgi:hypothetical protein
MWHVSALARRALPPDVKRRVVVMTTAYADDSRTPHYVAMAMYVATDDQWDRFPEQWRRNVLAPKRLAFFHARKFFGRKQAFRGWTEKEYERTFANVATTIKAHTTLGVYTYVDLQRYKSKLLRLNVTPYVFASLGCMIAMAALCRKRGLGSELLYVFDGGANEYRDLANLLNTIILLNDTRQKTVLTRRWLGLGTFAPGDKMRFPQIQAADVLAYCVTASQENPHGRYEGYFDALWAGGHHHYFDSEFIDLTSTRMVTVLDARRRQKWQRKRSR